MPLQPFTFAKKPDIRLVVYGDTVFKIKLNCRQSSDRNRVHKLCLEEKNHKDLERVICAVINASELSPVLTNSFVIYPYKHPWETREKLLFSRDGERLKSHAFAYTFYVEERKTGEPAKEAEHQNESVRGPEVYKCINSRSRASDSRDNSTLQPGQSTKDASSRKTNSKSIRDKGPVVSDYGQKNRHDIEENELKEFLRLQQMASVDDMDQLSDEDSNNPATRLERVFNALVSPVKMILGQQ